MSFEEFTGPDGQTSHYVLTCVSVGGPVTAIWRRDGTPITEGIETVLDDAVTAQYTTTLTVPGRTEGEYNCIVTNNKPFTDIRTLIVEAPDPPSDLQVSQNGMTSVLVTWAPAETDPPLATGYTITLIPVESGPTVQATPGPSQTSTTVFGLIEGATYSVVIVANSNTLSSNVTGPENVTIGIPVA
jgi:hypothetical protein